MRASGHSSEWCVAVGDQVVLVPHGLHPDFRLVGNGRSLAIPEAVSNWGTSSEVPCGVKDSTDGWMITLIERRGALPLVPPLRAYFSTDWVACADLIGESIGGRLKTL